MSDDAHNDGNDHHNNDEQHHHDGDQHQHGDEQHHDDEQHHQEQPHEEQHEHHDGHAHAGDQDGHPPVDEHHEVVDEHHQHHDNQGDHHEEVAAVVYDHQQQGHHDEPHQSHDSVEQPVAVASHQRQPSNTAVAPVAAAAPVTASPAHSRNSSQQIGGVGIAVHTRLGSVDINIGGGNGGHSRTNSSAAVPSSPAKAAVVTPRGNVDIVPASPSNATSAGASPVSEPPTPDFAAANAVLAANNNDATTPMTPPSAVAAAAAATGSHSRNPSVSNASHSRTPSVVPVPVAAVGTHSRTSSVSVTPQSQPAGGNHSRAPSTSAAAVEAVAAATPAAASGEAPSPRNAELVQPTTTGGTHSRAPSSAALVATETPTAAEPASGSHSRTPSVAAAAPAATESTSSRTHSRAPSVTTTTTTTHSDNGNGDVHGEVSVGGVSASLDVNVSSLFGSKKTADEPSSANETKNDTKAADSKPAAAVFLEELVEPVAAAAAEAAPTEETNGHSHDGENGDAATATTNGDGDGDTPSEKKAATRAPGKAAAPKTGTRVPPKSVVRAPVKRSVIATPTPRRGAGVRATPHTARTPKYPPGDINNVDGGDGEGADHENGNGEEKHDDEPIVERKAIGEMPRIRRTINLGVEVGETVNGSNGKPTGIRVVAVAPNEPAALAGLMRDDVIQKVRDKSTITAEAFNKIVRSFAPNTHVNFFILRKSSAQFKLELRVQQADSIDIGFEVHEHPGNELHVSGVLEGSDAEAKGIALGDIVRRVNGEEIIRKTMFDTSLRLVRPGDTVNFRISPINFKEPDRDVHVLVSGVAGEKKHRAIPPSGVPDPRSSRFSLSSRDLDAASSATPRRPGWVGALTADHHESSKSPQQMARDERWRELERQREERNEVMRRRLALVDERAQQAKDAEKQREIELEAKRAAAKIKREEAFRRKAELDREFKDATILKLEADRKRQTDDGLGGEANGENGASGEVSIAATLTTGPDGGLQLTPSAPRKLRGEFGEPPTLDEMISARRRKKGEVQNEIDEIEAAKIKRAAEREERKREVEQKIADRKQQEAEERERRAKEREEERNASQRARFRIARSSGGASVIAPAPRPKPTPQPAVSNSEKLVRPRKEGPPRGLGKKPAPKKPGPPSGSGEEKEAVAGSALPPRKPRVPHVERPKTAVPAKRAEPKTQSAPKREPRPKSAAPTPVKRSSVKTSSVKKSSVKKVVPAKSAAPAKRAAPKAKGEAKSRNVSAPSSGPVSPQGGLPPISPTPGNGATVLEEEVIVTQPAAATLSEDIFAPIAPITREPRAASSPSSAAGLSLSASLGTGGLSFSAEVTTGTTSATSTQPVPASSPSKATVKIAAIDDGGSNWSPSISPVGTPTNAASTTAAPTTTTAPATATTEAKSDAAAAPVAAVTTTTASGNATPAESPVATPVSPNPPTKRFAPPIVPGAKKRVDPVVTTKPKPKVAVDASYKSAGKEPIIGYQRRASAEQRQPSPERVVPHEKLFGSDEYDQHDEQHTVVTAEPTNDVAATPAEPVAAAAVVATPPPAPAAPVVAEPEPVPAPAVPVSVAIPETTAPVAATPPTPQAAAAAGNPSGKDVHGHWKVGDLVMARWEDWNMYIAVIEEKRPTGWFVTWTEYGQSGVVTAENIEARPAGATSSVAAVTAVTGAAPATIATPVPAASPAVAGDEQPHDGDDHDDGEDVTFDDDDHPELI